MGAMRVFRTFRCLRPLRAMSRLQGLKVELWNKGILHDWWREGNENLLKSLAVSNCTVGWLWKWELQIKDLCTQCLFTRNIKLDKHLYIHKCLNELLVNLKWQWWVRMSVRWYGTAWALPIKGINLTEGGRWDSPLDGTAHLRAFWISHMCIIWLNMVTVIWSFN